MTERIFTTSEIAGMLGVHQITISRWVNSGKLKSMFTLGGHRRIKEKDLVRFFRENDMPVPEDLDVPPEKVKVLVVDDDEPVLSVLAEGLGKSEDGFMVGTATDGFQAGQLIEKFHPDIVVLDIRLPGIDGYEVCRMIKEGHPDMKIIAITGFDSEEARRRIMEEGADRYLIKPFEVEDLVAEIDAVLDRKSLERSSR